MAKLLMTPEEAAESLSIGRSKLYELLATGEVESLRIGASRRIPVDALEEFVGRLRQSTGALADPGPLRADDGDATVGRLGREQR